MKDWQHGYELDHLKEIESWYERYNSYTLGPFAAYKKNDIAQDLHDGSLDLALGEASRVLQRVKVGSAINLYQDVMIAQKRPNDVVITKLECNQPLLHSILNPL